MGGYPEDYKVRISKLIRLWIAEGFLKPIESKSLEEVGEEYFKDLVNRNLVLTTGKKSDGRFKFCFMHDILRDMCSQRAHHENFLLCVRRKDDFQRVPISNVRRVYVQTVGGYSKILKYIKKHGSHVCSPKPSRGDESLSAASSCKLLRILDTRPIIRSTTFDELIELLHLRYLNLYVDSLILHRVHIFHLQNLQTLIVDANSTVLLPPEVWKMPQLRHVMSKFGITLPRINPYDEVRIIDGVPLLRSLQTLSMVRQPFFIFTRDIIEMIPNLKKLGFKCYSLAPRNWKEDALGNLVHLNHLDTLFIGFDISPDTMRFHCSMPENFAFPSSLIKLTLLGCQLPWKNMRVVGSLPNLQVLKLRKNAFWGSKWEPIEGQFLKLKFLEMESLMHLKYWRAENTHFPSLERLHIICCDSLEEIPPGIGDIPTLQLIRLVLRPASPNMAGYLCINEDLASSALEIQQQQQDLGNDDLQVLVQR